MLIFVSSDVSWLEEAARDCAREMPNVPISKIKIDRIDEKLGRSGFQIHTSNFLQKLDACIAAPRDREGRLVLFDFGMSARGSFDPTDHVGIANVFATGCLRFPYCDFRIYGARHTEFSDIDVREIADVFVTQEDYVSTLARLHVLAASALYDASGIRNFIRKRSWTECTGGGTADSLPVRNELALIVDDDDQRARLVGLSFYLAGYRAALICTGESFVVGLSAGDQSVFKSAYLSAQSKALDFGDQAQFGASFSLEARNSESRVLADTHATVVVSSDSMVDTMSFGKEVVYLGLPMASGFAVAKTLQEAGVGNKFNWPPSPAIRFEGPSKHSTPRQLVSIARDLLSASRACRVQSATVSTLLALEAMELVLARQSVLSVELAGEFHSALLALEIQNIGLFMASDLEVRTTRVYADVDAALASFSAEQSDIEAKRRHYRERCLAALVDIYKAHYHFDEELGLLDRVRSNTRNPVMFFANFVVGRWYGFVISSTFWILLFGVLFVLTGKGRCFSFEQLVAGITYSAVTFSTVSTSSSNLISTYGIAETLMGGWLIFMETVIAGGHWALLFAQVFVWFNRR
jgi:hypothetical protein